MILRQFSSHKKSKNLKKKVYRLTKIAILTRASFQFKDIEDRFLKENIKYRVVGGLRFYERAEIKDAMAYFRILINKSDNLSLERILNTPKRGLGKALIKNLYDIVQKNVSLYESLKLLILSGTSNSSQKKIFKISFLLLTDIHLL